MIKSTILHHLFQKERQSPYYDNLCRPVSDLLPFIGNGIRGVTTNPAVLTFLICISFYVILSTFCVLVLIAVRCSHIADFWESYFILKCLRWTVEVVFNLILDSQEITFSQEYQMKTLVLPLASCNEERFGYLLSVFNYCSNP